jgi:hypothetical protein
LKAVSKFWQHLWQSFGKSRLVYNKLVSMFAFQIQIVPLHRGKAETAAVLLAACPAAAALRDRKGLTPAERTSDAATLAVFG